MKRTTLPALAFLLAISLFAQQPSAPSKPLPEPSGKYVLVFLRRPAGVQPLPKEEGEKLLAAHLANIGKLADEGKLVVAGPFLDNPPTPLRGLFLMKTASIDEAKQWVGTDPMVKAGRLAPEYHLWQIPATTFNRPPSTNPMQNYAFVIYLKGEKYKPLSQENLPLLQRHIGYMLPQHEAGRIVIGGPFQGDDGEFFGAIITSVSPDEAKDMVAKDPFVTEGEVKPEIHPWMTQKGVLPEVRNQK
jgi:uncharacterized protein YciI